MLVPQQAHLAASPGCSLGLRLRPGHWHSLASLHGSTARSPRRGEVEGISAVAGLVREDQHPPRLGSKPLHTLIKQPTL